MKLNRNVEQGSALIVSRGQVLLQGGTKSVLIARFRSLGTGRLRISCLDCIFLRGTRIGTYLRARRLRRLECRHEG